MTLWYQLRFSSFAGGAGISGRYVVTRDITAAPGVRVIDIDLNGFTLSSDTWVVHAVDVRSFILRNGSIIPDGVRVEATGGTDRSAVIEDLKLAGGGSRSRSSTTSWCAET